MSLTSMLQSPTMTVQELAAWLDGMDHAGRMAAMATSSRAEQRRLWELAEKSAPLTLDHFLPPSVGPRTEVIHHGRNSLPVFRSFQKRMSRPEDGSARAFGYNEGSTRALIGPGYFVLHETLGHPGWEERGAQVVDYFMMPDGPVPAGWPKVIPNSQGPQILVYHRTRDFMRGVSAHVSIGAAFKVESPMHSWFTLVREDR